MSGFQSQQSSGGPDDEDNPAETLLSLAAGLGRPMDIGTAVMPELLENDDQYRAIIEAEFNCVVPEVSECVSE
jgi:hypothetical protein